MQFRIYLSIDSYMFTDFSKHYISLNKCVDLQAVIELILSISMEMSRFHTSLYIKKNYLKRSDRLLTIITDSK